MNETAAWCVSIWDTMASEYNMLMKLWL